METLTMEKRLSMAVNKLGREEQKLSNFIDTYIQDFGITRKTGLTLIARNFFISYDEDSIRNHEGFEKYYFSVDEEQHDRIELLFKCMNLDILLEISENDNTNSWITILLHHCPFEEPKHIEIAYNESLLKFINAYILGQINVKVTVDQLLRRILEIKNDY